MATDDTTEALDPLLEEHVRDHDDHDRTEQLRRHVAAEARDRAAERRDTDADRADGGTGAGAHLRNQAAIDRLHAARDRDDDA